MTCRKSACVAAASSTRLVFGTGNEAEPASEATAAPAFEAPAAEAATSLSGTTQRHCRFCRVVFPSNNQLHAHLREGCQSKRLPYGIRLLGAAAGRKRQRSTSSDTASAAAHSIEVGQVAAAHEGDAPGANVQQDEPEAPKQRSLSAVAGTSRSARKRARRRAATAATATAPVLAAIGESQAVAAAPTPPATTESSADRWSGEPAVPAVDALNALDSFLAGSRFVALRREGAPVDATLREVINEALSDGAHEAFSPVDRALAALATGEAPDVAHTLLAKVLAAFGDFAERRFSQSGQPHAFAARAASGAAPEDAGADTADEPSGLASSVYSIVAWPPCASEGPASSAGPSGAPPPARSA